MKDYVAVRDEYNNALALNEGKYNLYTHINKEYKLYQGYKNEKKYSKLLTIKNVDLKLIEFTRLYGGKDVDSLNMLSKAEELLELYKVLDVRCADFRLQGDYLSHTLWGYIIFDEKQVNSEKKSYFEALEIVREKSKSSSSSFKNFYKTVCPEFVAKEYFYQNEFRDRAYDVFYKAKVKELADKCVKCKIEGKKTTFPKGYVEGYKGLFFDTPAQSEKEGTIKLRNGDYIIWKFVYGERRITIMTSGVGYDGEYNSVDEMMEGIITKCHKKFCH